MDSLENPIAFKPIFVLDSESLLNRLYLHQLLPILYLISDVSIYILAEAPNFFIEILYVDRLIVIVYLYTCILV